MAQIRRKTAYDYREAFRLAREQGILLSWNRYEGMLPQDGFARLGLSCFDCLMGPCRINPFARPAERTVCGFTGDDLTYRTVMRLLGASPEDGDPLKSMVGAAKALLDPYKPRSGGAVKVGPGALKADRINICAESGDSALLGTLCGDGIKVSTVGALVPGYDCASSLGEAELLLLTGLVDVYVTGSRCIGLPRGVAETLHTRIMSADDPAAVVAAAREAGKNRVELHPDERIHEIEARSMGEALAKAGGEAVILGGDGNIKLTLDQLALDSVRALREKDIPVIICGGMAAALAKYELEGVVYCADDAAALLREAKESHLVLLPEIAGGRGLAEAIGLGGGGHTVLTATELPLGNGPLGEELGKLARYAGPAEYLKRALSLQGGAAGED